MFDVVNILFTFVFVLVGSFTFHISALISGVSIFRDRTAQQATLISLTVGIVLLAISPFSFMILERAIEKSAAANDTATLVRNFIEGVLTSHIIMPFFLSTVGLGLVVGALIIIDARVMFLTWFREKTNMLFGIKSYTLTWDDFLSSIKRDGIIDVRLRDKLIRGHLKHFSIRSESPVIWLGKYALMEDSGWVYKDATYNDAEMLIKCQDIEQISAPAYSFNKHYESMRHVSQGFYLLLMVVGLFLLSQSLYGTADYLLLGKYADLGGTYALAGLLLLVLALVLLFVADYVVTHDFSSWQAAIYIYPEIFVFSAWGALVIIYDLLGRLAVMAPGLYEYRAGIVLLLGFLVFTFSIIRYFFRLEMYQMFDGIEALQMDRGDPSLREYLEEVYTKLDLNKSDTNQKKELWDNLEQRFKKFWGQGQLEEVLEPLFVKRPYLDLEWQGLMLRFQFYIRKKKK